MCSYTDGQDTEIKVLGSLHFNGRKVLYLNRHILLILISMVAPIAFIPHTYAISPYEVGYNMAKLDYLHNKPYNYACSPSNGKAYCEAYKIGYDSAWDVARVGWFG